MLFVSAARFGSPRLRGGFHFSPAFFRFAVLGLLLLVVAHSSVFAQAAGPTPAQTMVTIKNIGVLFLRGIMSIGLIIALVKVARNFMDGSSDAVPNFFWLMGGLIIFFGWGYFMRNTMGSWSAPTPTIGNIGNSTLNPAVSAGAYTMAQDILDTMLTTVVPLLLFTTIVITIVRGFISSGSVQFEIAPILKVLFLYIVLLGYNVFVPQVGNLVGGLAEMIAGQQRNSNTSAYSLLKDMQAKAGTGTVAVDAGATGNQTLTGTQLLSGISGAITTAYDKIATTFSPRTFILGLATDFITGMIQSVMEFIQSFLLAFLYVVGPIAIAFSFLPGFGGVAKSWLQSLIGIHMWSIAFTVIAGIFKYYTAYQTALTANSVGAQILSVTGAGADQYAVACIVFIIMYLMVPYMASLILGSTAADGFVGAAVRMGAAAAGGVAMAGGAAMGVAGAGAKAVNAANAGGSVGSKASTFAQGALGGMKNSMGMGEGSNASAIGQMFSAPPMAAAAPAPPAPRTGSTSGTVPNRYPATQGNSQGNSQGSSQGGSQGSSQAPAPAQAPVQAAAQSAATMAGVSGGSVDPNGAADAAVPSIASAASVQSAVTSAGTSSASGNAGGFGNYTNKKYASLVPAASSTGQAPPTM